MADSTQGLELEGGTGLPDPFLEAYGRGDESLASFYPGSPWDAAAYRRKLEDVDARFDRAARAAMKDALRPVNEQAQEKLRRVVEEQGLVVTTGQQPGLFGGPLYTLYKAVTAVELAAALEPLLGRPVLAVFWIASDDHDWAEANHTFVLDRANELVRLGWPAEQGGDQRANGPSMARRPLGPEVEQAVARLEQALPPSDFAPELLESIRRSYTPETAVADAFADLLASLLRDVPIALVQSSHATLKERSARVLRHELENGAEHERMLRQQVERLSAAGFDAQVPILDGAEQVFHEDDKGRERLLRQDSGWATRATARRFERDELLRELEEHPERFSPNVLLRPVVESTVLPTAAYVAGPAELRYFAELGCLFDAHGVGMPLVYPRASFTVVESKVRKVLDKFGLEHGELRRPAHELAGRLASEQLPDEVTEALQSLRRSLGEGYGRLIDAARQIDTTLKGPISSARNTSFGELDDAEKRITKAIKDQNRIAMEQIEKAKANLYPRGKPQERILNPHHYLARYGREFLARIREAAAVRLDRDAPAWSGVDCGGGVA